MFMQKRRLVRAWSSIHLGELQPTPMNLRSRVFAFTILVEEMRLVTLVLSLKMHKAPDCFSTTVSHLHHLLVIRKKRPLFTMP